MIILDENDNYDDDDDSDDSVHSHRLLELQ